MSELSGVLEVAADNTAGVFDLSANTLAVLYFALNQIENYEYWKDFKDEELTASDRDDIDRLVAVATYEVMNMSKVGYIGMIVMSWSDTIPDGWLWLDGDAISKTTYPELFDIFGYVYGGGGDTFVLPTMKGFSPYGAGADIDLGDSGGADTHTLSEAELPAHNHSVTDTGHTHAERLGTGNLPAYQGTGTGGFAISGGVSGTATRINTDSNTTGISIGNTGSGDAFSLLHAVKAVNFIIYAGR